MAISSGVHQCWILLHCWIAYSDSAGIYIWIWG
ncbi:hypothetical protein LINPERPRIM_LOCUS31440 [Linum perenne]